MINTIFRHPGTEHIPLRFTQGQCKLREGEGSQRRDSSAGDCTDPERSEGECGLRMTAQTEFRNSPIISRMFKYILFIFFLTGINFVYTALAEENTAQGVIIRPQIKYKSSQLRDPFQSYLIKEEKSKAGQEQGADNLVKPKLDLNLLEVQGIIWGGKIPQSIINNKVLAIGDSINGAEILSIDKSGITLNFAGEILNLSAPGQGVASKKIE